MKIIMELNLHAELTRPNYFFCNRILISEYDYRFISFQIQNV